MTIVTDENHDSGLIIIAWIITVITGGYMLPWAIAATRGKSNSSSVGWINLLLGWTVIGWIWALIKALGSHNVITIQQPPQQ